MADLNAFNGNLYVDINASIGARSAHANPNLKLEVTSLIPEGTADVSPIVGITTPQAQDFLTLSCANSTDPSAQISWKQGSLCLGTNAGFDRTSFSEHLRITQTGNVGIGVESPMKKLEVAGEFQSTGVVRAGGGFRSSTDDWEIAGADADLVIRDPGQPSAKLRVASTGNVGIGIEDPQEKLHINGSVRGGDDQNGALRISTGTGHVEVGPQGQGSAEFRTDQSRYYFDKELCVDSGMIGSYDEDLQLRTSGSTRVTIRNDSGNVGIGVESPAKKLEVAGEFQSTGVVRAGGGFRSSGDHWEIVEDEADLVIRDPGQDSEKLRVTSTGNVGIGVLPDYQSKLHLGGGTAAGLAGGGALVIGATDGNNLALDTGGIMARNNMTKSVLNLQTDGGDLAVHGRQGEPSRFVIKDDGKVGVGTPEPIEKLHVGGNILMTGRYLWMRESLRSLHVESGGSQDNYLHINAFGDHPAVKINQNAARPFDVNSGKLHVSSTGNVGIGTDSPETKFKVTGGSAKFVTNSGNDPLIISRLPTATGTQGAQELRIGVGDSVATIHYINDEAVNRFDFRMQNTDTEAGGGAKANNNIVMSIVGDKDGGKVGIGTSTPGAKLEVNGRIERQGNEVLDTGNFIIRSLRYQPRYYWRGSASGNVTNFSISLTTSQDGIIVAYMNALVQMDGPRKAIYLGPAINDQIDNGNLGGYRAFSAKQPEWVGTAAFNTRKVLPGEHTIQVKANIDGGTAQVAWGSLVVMFYPQPRFVLKDFDKFHVLETGRFSPKILRPGL